MIKVISTDEGIADLKSRIEDVVAPDMEASGMSFASIRQQINGGVPDNRQKVLQIGQFTLEQMVATAPSQGYGVYRILPKEGDKPQEVKFYRSCFLERILKRMERPLESVLGDIKAGKELEFEKKIDEVLMKKAVEANEKGSLATGATLFDQEVAIEMETRLSKLLNTPYNGTKEHKKIAGERVYYSKLDALGKNMQGNQPTDAALGTTYEAAVREIDILVGKDANTIKGKDLAAIRADYDRQVKTADVVWNIIAPLYAQIELASDEERYFVNKKQGKAPPEEARYMLEKVADFKKQYVYITEKVFEGLINTIRVDLQGFCLRSGKGKNLFKRFEYYEDLKKSLAKPRQLAKKLAIPVPRMRVGIDSPKEGTLQTTVDLSDAVKSACRYYLAKWKIRKKTKENAIKEASQAIDRIRNEELIRGLFYSTFDELDDKIRKQAKGREEPRCPSDEELDGALRIVWGKVNAVIPGFGSIFWSRYPTAKQEGRDVLTPEATQNLAYDFWDTFKYAAWIARDESVKTGEDFVYKFVLPKLFIQLGEDLGDRMPSCEKLYKAYQAAIEISKNKKVKPKLSCRLGSEKDTRKKHYKLYRDTMVGHRKGQDELYKAASQKR